MTTEEILNGNKLIAEFLGLKPTQHGEYEIFQIFLFIENEPEAQHFFQPDDMLFDSDWNWLMPVVGKIEEMEYDFNILGGSWVIIRDVDPKRTDDHDLLEVDGDSKLDAVYKAVIEFIKWYNLNN